MPKKSGKDKGSITQKAQDQDVRISQVSNVSRAVSAMGKKTEKEMNETKRRISEGGDSRVIAGSMNSVLASLKSTIDTLEKGVHAATFGTAKAAQEAIQQYGKAISEDIKINKQNMVASSLASATPIFGYFASKFLETDIYKKTKERMSAGISSIFKRKSEGGSIPDDFGGDDGRPMTPAQAKTKAVQEHKAQRDNTIEAMKIVNKEKYEKYDKSTEEKTLLALSAIQGAVGAEFGKFETWYNRFLEEHPYYRRARTVYKALAATMGGAWKAVYFFWRPRGGYAKHLSKAKNPFEAMNQNLGALFVQSMPRLDAIMLYTKATAEAVRDMSTKYTKIRYPKVDPSNLGGTWSLAGKTMGMLRGIGRGVAGLARWGVGKVTTKGSKTNILLNEIINASAAIAGGIDLGLTFPGRIKSWLGGRSAAAKESARHFGGLGETGGTISTTRKRYPKVVPGMGRRIMPDAYVQGVYDEYFIKKDKKDTKDKQKLLGWTGDMSKGIKEINKREKRRSIMGFLGSIFGGIKDLFLTGLMFGKSLFGGGIKGFFTTLLMNPLFWKATGIVSALVGGSFLQKWLDTKFKDADSIWGSMWRMYKQSFPGVDLGLRVHDGVAAGIGRWFRGEPFDVKRVIVDSIVNFFKEKFGGLGSLKDMIFGSKEEKIAAAEKYNVTMTDKAFGKKNAEIIRQKAENYNRLMSKKGVTTKEKLKAYYGIWGDTFKSILGMELTPAEPIKEDFRTKIDRAKDKVIGAAQELKTVTIEQAKELSKKYGGLPQEYFHMTMDQAKLYGARLKEELTSPGSFAMSGKQQAWQLKNEFMKSQAGAFVSSMVQKSGEYIEIGKGNFIEIYRQGTGKAKEVWETASPEKKAIIKQQIDRLLASGEITKKELERMGIKLKDAASEAGEKIGGEVGKAVIVTSNAVSNAVNSVNTGSSSGGGGSSSFMQEKTMDDISRGDLWF